MQKNNYANINLGFLCEIDGMNGTQLKIINYMISLMDNGNYFHFSQSQKIAFCEKHKIERQTLNNNISKVIKMKLITPIGRDEFLIRRILATKGVYESTVNRWDQEFKSHFVYKILDSNTGDLLYIGETKDLKQRLSNHSHMEKNRKAVFTICDNSKIGKDLESLMIYKLKPRLNKLISNVEPPNHYGFDIESIEWISDIDEAKSAPSNDRFLVKDKNTGEEIDFSHYMDLLEDHIYHKEIN